MIINGVVQKAISGFYYVKSDGILYECKARGSFRKKGFSPLCGDNVKAEINGKNGVITEIVGRKNSLVRPPVANIDKLFVVSSSENPAPNCLLIDRITVIAESKGIEPILVFNKNDLANLDEYRDVYIKSGFKAYSVSAFDPESLRDLKEELRSSLCVFTGNSGVGKSSLLNALFPKLSLKTGEVSEKLGRGRHTTRHVELFETDGGIVADTPGFSSLDLQKYEIILKDDLPDLFRDFAPYIGECRFSSCSHTTEKGCAVLKAVEEGEIVKSRHDSYVAIYNDIKNIKEWEIKK